MAVQAYQACASLTPKISTFHVSPWSIQRSELNAFLPSLHPASGRRQQRKLFIRAEVEDDDFEAKLATIRRRGGSGTGKKAELRKARKEGVDSTVQPKVEVKDTILLPPSPVKEATSGGLPIALGFNAYTERLNGRLAALGLAALLSVELASGKGLFSYHDSSTIAIQIYAILSLSALYIKWEKEKRSVWPK